LSDALFSPSWYRVADLKPRIRAHTVIHRHAYRDKVWFILQDQAAGRSHRFSPAAHHFIGLMDGNRTVQEIWDASGQQLGDAAPTQEEVFRRHQRHTAMEWKRRLWTPLALRFPLWDPDRFLDRTLPYTGWIFGWIGALLWLAVVGTGVVMTASHWTELTRDVVDRLLAPQNLLLLWLVYPVVKALHELGHAYATKKFGGEVHEIGLMLLVLTPVPYVDATAAWGFRDKRQRMLVGAAGIAVELFLGSLALFVWLWAEAGAVRAIAYNVMLISGVSTLLFNGNPLLRFDGYYVLADAIEIPNLGTRANRYLGYLFQRYALAAKDTDSPADTTGERVWMALYGIAAFIYRCSILFVIIIFIAGKFFIVGILLAAWALGTQVFTPVAKSVSFLAKNPTLRRQRGRAVGTSLAIALGVLVLVFLVPAPSWTRAQGVIWVPEEAQVRAGTEGFIERLLVPVDSQVVRGQALIQAADPFLHARVKVLEAQVKELAAQYDALIQFDRVQALVVREELASVQANLARAQERERDLTLRAGATGRLVVPNAADLPGRFVQKGTLVAYVVEPKELTARAAVGQDYIDLVRSRQRGVEVMVADWGAAPIAAEIRREVPGASKQLPSSALGSQGGGPFAVDPRDNQGVTAVARVFQVELALPEDFRYSYLGARVFVRFNHGWEPLGVQAYRAIKRVFLRIFNV